ncbi:MAG: N-acetylglucosamine kinase [Promethearchaeota archaeon]
MGLYLGILGAARESQIALATDQGKIVAYMRWPPLTARVNIRLSDSLRNVLNQLANIIDMTHDAMIAELHGVCVSMSGVYFDSDRAALRLTLGAIGLQGSFPLLISEDVNAFLASNFLSVGAIITAGTGSNVVARGHRMLYPIRVNGWGSIIGDAGGGYDLGVNCLRRILQGLDEREDRADTLERRILSYIGLSRPEDLIQWYYNVSETVRWRSDIADLAIPLMEAAEQDEDDIAKGLVEQGAVSLLESFKVAIRKMANVREKFAPEPVSLIFEGGLFENSRTYINIFKSWLSTRPTSEIQFEAMMSKYEPVVGALALAIAGELYLDEKRAEHDSLMESANQTGLRIGNETFF